MNPEYPILEKNKQYPLCNLVREMIVCAKYNLTRYPTSRLYEKCTVDCPLECDSVSYSIETSNANYPSDDYAYRLKRYGARNQELQFNANTSVSTIKANSLYVRVFYSDLSYQSINQIPQITFDQLLGTIGGQLGSSVYNHERSPVKIIHLTNLTCC